MSFYGGLANTADNLIKRFGQTVTLHQSVPGAYSHGQSTNTITDHIGVGVVSNYNQKEIDGTRIQFGDVKLLLSAFASDGSAMPQPTSADTLTANGVTYGVVSPIMPTNPAGTVVMYEVQLRGK